MSALRHHSHTSNPLFSILCTTSLLTLLYLPRRLLPFLLSPITLSTLILLFTLLHFGSKQVQQKQETSEPDEIHQQEEPISEDADNHDDQPGPTVLLPQKVETSFYDDHFFGWCHRGPLEVIYEDYEGEEAEEEEEGDGYSGNGDLGCAGLCYTDSESGSDSDEVSGSICFMWEDEEEMIEIELEEDNLIEIDLSTHM